MTLDVSVEMVSGYLLAMVRTTVWVFFCPPFNRRSIPRRIKGGFAAALTLVVGPQLAKQGVPLETGPLVASAAMQAVVGLALAFIVAVLFYAVQAAGALIDIMGGFSVAQIYDPNTAATVTVFSRFYEVLAMTVLVISNGHLLLVRGLVKSFDAAPFTTDSLSRLQTILQADVRMLFVAGLQIALPVVAAMFVTDVAIGLLSKAAPTLNVVLLGLPLKILLTFLIVGMSVTLLPDEVGSLLESAMQSMAELLRR